MDHILKKFLTPEARRTKSGRLLSDYFTNNLHEAPFETVSSIADKVGLSPMTVTRYLRELGYGSLHELKLELRHGPISSAWDISDSVDALRREQGEGRLLSELVVQQIEVLQRLHQLTHSPDWQPIVDALVQTPNLHIASYQNIGYIVRYFSEQMTYVRPGVRYVDGMNGTYVEVFDSPAADTLLVLVDCRRFASKSQLLYQAAMAAGIKVLLITDSHCDWAQEDNTLTLTIPIMGWRTWDSFMPLAALLDLLVTSCVVSTGASAVSRANQIRSLQDHFSDFAKG